MMVHVTKTSSIWMTQKTDKTNDIFIEFNWFFKHLIYL
jgi:hypothetical protein